MDLALRDIRPEDKAALARFHNRLSLETKIRRFHGAKGELTARELRFLTEVDGHQHVALVAEDADGEFAGVVRAVGDVSAPGQAELAVVVADDWHKCGIGHLLVEALLERCVAEGHQRVILEVQADNYRALRFFQRFGARQLAMRDRVARLVIEP